MTNTAPSLHHCIARCNSRFSSRVSAFLAIAVLFALSLGAGTQAFAQGISAARVMATAGPTKAVDPQGRERALDKGGEIFAGERIVTGDAGLVQLRLHDGGFMSVRPGTDMVIDRFVYDDKDASKSSFLVSLVRGGFRSITGLIGRTNPKAYEIRAGTATLGIRGTDHEPMMIPEGVPSMAKLGAPGLYDKVNDGETFIRNAKGLLALKRGEIGFSPINTDKPPQPVRGVPDFYKADLKVDARDPKDTDAGNPGERKKGADADEMMLRPTTAARRAALKDSSGAADTNPGTTTLRAPTTTLVAPTTLIAPTTQVAPTTTLASPSTTLVAPTNTVTAPTTVKAPTTTLIAPTTTLVAPTTTLIAPTTTLIAPTTTLAPNTTLTQPKLNSTTIPQR